MSNTVGGLVGYLDKGSREAFGDQLSDFMPTVSIKNPKAAVRQRTLRLRLLWPPPGGIDEKVPVEPNTILHR